LNRNTKLQTILVRIVNVRYVTDTARKIPPFRCIAYYIACNKAHGTFSTFNSNISKIHENLD